MSGPTMSDHLKKLAAARRTLRVIASWAAGDHRSGLRREEAITAIYQQAMMALKETSDYGHSMDAGTANEQRTTGLTHAPRCRSICSRSIRCTTAGASRCSRR
jgi:hypothetical protein